MKNDKYLVAVSGGPDSMAVLHQQIAKGQEVAVAHINYNVRESALRDEKIVEEFCKNNDIVLYKYKAPKCDENNFQAWARKYRYDIMEKLCIEHKYAGIITGHHLDDSLETYMLQKQRQNIVTHYGLTYKSKYGNTDIVRVALTKTKEELITYCNESNIKYGIDESNEDDKYERNKIRKELYSLNKKEHKKLFDEMLKSNNSNELLFKTANKLYDKYFDNDSVSRELFHEDNKEIIWRALYKFLTSHGYNHTDISRGLLEEIYSFNYKVTQGNATIDLKGNFKIKNKNGRFYIIK